MTVDAAIPTQPLIAVDVVAVRFSSANGLQVGTVTRRFEPFAGDEALPGVLLDTGELLADAAVRALHTKAGVPRSAIGPLRAAGTFDRPGRDPREHAISIAWVTALPYAVRSDLHWAAPASSTSLPFDHDQIIAAALVEARHHLWSDAEFTSALTGNEFSTRDASALETALDGTSPRAGNLARTLAAIPRLERAGSEHAGERGRPTTRWRWLNPP